MIKVGNNKEREKRKVGMYTHICYTGYNSKPFKSR